MGRFEFCSLPEAEGSFLSSPTPIGDPESLLFLPFAKRKTLDPRVRKDDRKKQNLRHWVLN